MPEANERKDVYRKDRRQERKKKENKERNKCGKNGQEKKKEIMKKYG